MENCRKATERKERWKRRSRRKTEKRGEGGITGHATKLLSNSGGVGGWCLAPEREGRWDFIIRQLIRHGRSGVTGASVATGIKLTSRKQ